MVELLVIDFEDLGENQIKEFCHMAPYIAPTVVNMTEKDIGEWTDDHPLNKSDTWLEYYKKLFYPVCGSLYSPLHITDVKIKDE